MGGKVVVDTYDIGTLWPDQNGITRAKVNKLSSANIVSSNGLDNVGYADDTTIMTRMSEGEKRREITYEVYGEWGHTIHPDKWQRLPAKRRHPKE